MYTLKTLPLFGWIIFLLVLASGVAALLWFLWFGRKIRFPPGDVRTVLDRGCRVHVIIDPVVQAALGGTPIERDLKATKLSVRTAAAVSSIRVSWMKTRTKYVSPSILDNVAVYFLSSAEFDKNYPKAAAFLIHTPTSVGSGIPMAVVRDMCIPEVQVNGEPVIHEMIHALLGEYSKTGVDRDHTDTAWKAVSGDKSEQALAEADFKLRW